jgi:hypothetical protein
MLRPVLGELHGRGRPVPAGVPEYVYFDDYLLSGSRTIKDLSEWLEHAPGCERRVHLVFLAACTHGLARTHHRLMQRAEELGQAIRLHWWHVERIDDHPARFDTPDVLRPSTVPAAAAAEALFRRMRPRLREGPTAGREMPSQRFSSERRRSLLEEHLAIAGLDLMAVGRLTRSYVRPLGLQELPSFGFGALVASWRSCPNHCPLALWLGSPEQGGNAPVPWYPLFPRDPVQQTFELFQLTDSMFHYPEAAALAREPPTRSLPLPPADQGFQPGP